MTVELRGQGDVNHPLASRDCQALIDYLIQFDAIVGETKPQPPLPYPATPLAGVEPVTTPVGGLLVFSALPGQYLEAGQLIAEIIDPISDQLMGRAGAGLGLAIVATPLAAIIPFVDPGDAKSAQCGPILAGARASAQRTTKGEVRDDVGKGTTAKGEDGKQSKDEGGKQRKKFLGIF